MYAATCYYVPPNMCARPLDSGGSVCNLTTAFSSKPERKEQILQIAAVFLRLAIFRAQIAGSKIYVAVTLQRKNVTFLISNI